MSKEIKDNWFIVLGLDFYPVAEENEEKIKEKSEGVADHFAAPLFYFRKLFVSLKFFF